MTEVTAMTLEELLEEQLRRYPLMQPKDFVKLLYQSEFGAAHFSGTPEESLEALENEFAEVEYEEEMPLYEEIGNGMLRLNLAAVDPKEYPLETLNEDFLASAAEKQGSNARLEALLRRTSELIDSLPFVFTRNDYLEFVNRYRALGYPVLSHSREYRKLYKPHYRLVAASRRHDFLKERMAAMPQKRRVLRLILLGVILIALIAGMAVLGRFLYVKLVL